ncbi:hypothetical protein [Photobacterium sp. Hal280]|uniref:hypothetical protein n=1 Tax=Photobacterium sp. Hal280 TaxID=3035163 RepID=UPI00301BCBC1
MQKEPQNPSATYLTQPEKSHSLHGNDSLKMYIDGTAKEQTGLSGHSLAPQRVSGAHHTMPKEPQNSSATYLSRTKIHQPQHIKKQKETHFPREKFRTNF